MSDELIFDTVAYQNGANTSASYKEQYDAVNATPYQYKSHAERIQAQLGRRALATRYSANIYTRFYAITVTSPTAPSTSGPGSTGWGSEVGKSGNYPINFLNAIPGISYTDYVGLVSSGYIYSPINTTIQFLSISDDGIIVNFNSQTVINDWSYHSPTTDTSAVYTLPIGYTPIQVLFFNGQGGLQCTLKYSVGGGPFNLIGGVV
jgi:hypothetical protein